MTKGGARKASANKAVAKGMGISVFFKVLEEINRLGKWISVDEVMVNLPNEFGGERNETCRSYFKELWRYSLIHRKEKNDIIKCTPLNWKKGGRPLYKISEKGKELLDIPDKHRVFALAWLFIQLDNTNDFEQLHKAIYSFKKGDVPLSMFKASAITGVVKDSIKALMYGWLEPLGFLDRTDKGMFRLDRKYYDKLKSTPSMRSAIPKNLGTHCSTDKIKIMALSKLPPIAPEIDGSIQIPFMVISKSNQTLEAEIEINIHDLFDNRVKDKIKTKKVKLNPFEKKEVTFQLDLLSKKISESFKPSELGHYIVKCNSEKKEGALPLLFLTTKAFKHELFLYNTFRSLGLGAIMFTKSDRPDMVVFPERKEEDLTKFLHNNELKILVEATSTDILSYQKVKDDLDNFVEHTNKVLKINSKHTLIVGNKIAGSVNAHSKSLIQNYHPFTIISMSNLLYLQKNIQKLKKDPWKVLKKILLHRGIADYNIIKQHLS